MSTQRLHTTPAPLITHNATIRTHKRTIARRDSLNLHTIYRTPDPLGIPTIPPSHTIPTALAPWRHAKAQDATAHFFLNDALFEPTWRNPQKLLNALPHSTLSPDYSVMTDMPYAIQIWQTYRNRWTGCYLHQHGHDVIPTITWSDPNSYDFAFRGVHAHSTVALSVLGIRTAPQRALFLAGFNALLQILDPHHVIVYGSTNRFNVTDWGVDITVYPSRYDKPFQPHTIPTLQTDDEAL